MLAGLMLLLSVPASLTQPIEAKAAEEINGHTLIAQNSNYELYFLEDDLSVVVRDKATGSYMESSISYDDGKNNKTWIGMMQSAVVLTLIYQNVDTQQADLVNDDVQKTITYTDDGFSAECYWTKYKVGLTLEVSLKEDGLVARIADESIVEEGDTYYIGTISMYPFMGTSYLNDKEGYMYIPDGNGALIYLDDKDGRFSNGYSSMIYGNDIGFDESTTESLLWSKYSMINDAEEIISPTFGIAHTDNQIGFLAIVEDGSMRATIEAMPNGVSVDYNRVYAKFIERLLYTQPTSNNSTSGSFKLTESARVHSDLAVRYLFLSGREANYCGMATAYREYLMDKGILEAGDTSYNTRVDFLGTEREDWLLGTTSVVMTTVDDIYDIYADLESEGITEIMSIYKGWQKKGLYNVPISSFKADSKIGGTNKLAELISDSESKGISLYLYNDALRINPEEQNATFNVVKKVNKKKFEEETYKDVYDTFQYLIPARTKVMVNKFMKSYLKKNVSSIAIAGISNNLYSYSYSGTTYSRFDTAASYKELLNTVDESTDLVLEQPFSYLWEYTDAFLDMPLYTSEYIYEDTFIPFLSIVLKGVMPVYSEYVNFEANKQEYFLKLVETGMFPSFYITKESSSELIYTNSSDIYSSQYSVYRDTIIEYGNKLSELNKKLEGAYIIAHEILSNEVVVVTYDNGVVIYINYSEKSQTVNGNSVDSMSYKVVG